MEESSSQLERQPRLTRPFFGFLPSAPFGSLRLPSVSFSSFPSFLPPPRLLNRPPLSAEEPSRDAATIAEPCDDSASWLALGGSKGSQAEEGIRRRYWRA